MFDILTIIMSFLDLKAFLLVAATNKLYRTTAESVKSDVCSRVTNLRCFVPELDPCKMLIQEYVKQKLKPFSNLLTLTITVNEQDRAFHQLITVIHSLFVQNPSLYYFRLFSCKNLSNSFAVRIALSDLNQTQVTYDDSNLFVRYHAKLVQGHCSGIPSAKLLKERKYQLNLRLLLVNRVSGGQDWRKLISNDEDS